MRLIIALFCLIAACIPARSADAVFTLIRTVPAAELNHMLDAERASFIAGQTPGSGYELPAVATAANDVEIYSVRYPAQVPEQGGRPVLATGLVALPVLKDRARLPLISYQHGTVFAKHEVPSFAFLPDDPASGAHYDGSYETRYMVGLFAGNGYALMAADYFGMGGDAASPEAYFVKASTQQASLDLYRAVQSFLAGKGIATQGLFLGGWSQGGLNTSGLLERMEAEDIAVTAAFTASAPSDPYAALSGLMFYPRPGLDAPWINTIVALSVYAFQNYLGPADLAERTLDPAVRADLQAIYERSYTGEDGLRQIMARLGNRAVIDYFRPELRDPVRFATSDYGRLLAQAETYRQSFAAPLRMFYGSDDEVVKPMIGQLAAIYQAILIGTLADQSRNPVSAVEVKGGTHRLTFIAAAPAAKGWMDQLRP